jgi:hypothetical protein
MKKEKSMGRVTDILRKLRDMSHMDLFNRFKQIARAQAVHEYIGDKEDIDLNIEVNLAGEELLKRMSSQSKTHQVVFPVIEEDEEET